MARPIWATTWGTTELPSTGRVTVSVLFPKGRALASADRPCASLDCAYRAPASRWSPELRRRLASRSHGLAAPGSSRPPGGGPV